MSFDIVSEKFFIIHKNVLFCMDLGLGRGSARIDTACAGTYNQFNKSSWQQNSQRTLLGKECENMIEKMLRSLTFWQMEIFLTAAKYENFSRAAEELFMTQASVSRNIMGMEDALGIVLFVRHRQRVVLTEAGKSLQKDLSNILKRTENAYQRALEKQRNQYCSLKIGDVLYTSADKYLIPITRAFEEEFPEVELVLERNEADVLIDNLESERYDAIFLIDALMPNVAGQDILRERVCSVEPCAVIADTHPLFEKEEITLDDLQGQPLLASRELCYRYYWDYVCQVCRDCGLKHGDVRFEENFFTIRMELQKGKRMVIADSLFGSMLKERVRMIPLKTRGIRSGVSLLYSRGNSNPLLQRFRGVCRQFYGQDHTFCV